MLCNVGTKFLVFYFVGIHEVISTNFAVQRQHNHGFSAVACDQTIEQTINRDSKTKGGLIGFSMNRSTVHRWLLSQAERASITSKCKDMAGNSCTPRYLYKIGLFIYIYSEVH